GGKPVGTLASDTKRAAARLTELCERQRRTKAHPPRPIGKAVAQLRDGVIRADGSQSARCLSAHAPIAVAHHLAQCLLGVGMQIPAKSTGGGNAHLDDGVISERQAWR